METAKAKTVLRHCTFRKSLTHVKLCHSSSMRPSGTCNKRTRDTQEHPAPGVERQRPERPERPLKHHHVIDLSMDDPDPVPDPAPAPQSSEDKAARLLLWMQTQDARCFDAALRAQLDLSGPFKACDTLSACMAKLRRRFWKRVKALPRPHVEDAAAYVLMTPAEKEALALWEQLYARSFLLFDETFGKLAEVLGRLSEQSADAWTLNERLCDVVYDLGEWLDAQEALHAAVSQDQGQRNSVLESFVAGFAKFAKGLQPHASKASNAGIDVLPDWEKLYRRMSQRFDAMCQALRGTA